MCSFSISRFCAAVMISNVLNAFSLEMVVTSGLVSGLERLLAGGGCALVSFDFAALTVGSGSLGFDSGGVADADLASSDDKADSSATRSV